MTADFQLGIDARETIYAKGNVMGAGRAGGWRRRFGQTAEPVPAAKILDQHKIVFLCALW